jgi:nucleotide-binding universal stress UspA family protein
VDPGGVVILAHIAFSTPVVEEGDEGAAFVQREGIEHAFEKLADDIRVGRSIRVETITRTGDPATELLAAAQQIRPDIIATARQRHHLITRLLLGSVSRQLVCGGEWSMLITPAVHGLR